VSGQQARESVEPEFESPPPKEEGVGGGGALVNHP